MNNDYIRNAFKSLEDLKVVIEPVKTPVLFEDIDAEPLADDSGKTLADLFNEAGSYILTHEFDNNGTKFELFMEGLNDGESCDILFDEYDINNINEVLIEILDEEHDFIDSLHVTDFNLDSSVADVTKAACDQLNGTESSEASAELTSTEDEEDEKPDTNVRDYVAPEENPESEPQPEDNGETLPPVEAEINPADIKDAPAEEPQEESLNADKKFIKTRNSKVDAVDLAAELDANDIEYEMADDGLYVSAKDFNRAQSMLDQLEMDDADESLEEEAKFNLQDDEEVKEAEEIIDKDEGDAVEQIVDAAAETQDDLQKTYIGSIILQCPTCRTMIYKNPEQLVKSEGESDEDEVLYNVDEECPHCGARDGFELIGQVASLDVNPEGEPVPPMSEPTPAPEEPKEEEEDKVEAEPLPELPKDEPEHKEEVHEDITPVAQEPCKNIELTTEEKNMLDKLTHRNKMDCWFWIDDKHNCIRDLENHNKKMDTCEAILLIADGVVDIENFLDDDEIRLFDELVERCRECKANKKVKVKEEAPVPEDHPVAECKKSDVVLEAIDELKYDRLITRYLRENYANVKSYKTMDAAIDDVTNKVVFEGVITFKSGKEKPTKFVFEAKEITKKNQLKLVGMNETFSNSTKAFTLLGQVANKRLISESLSYRYDAGEKKVKGKIEPQRKR